MLVDTAGLSLVQRPGRFDVLLTENTFGDILSDVAAGVTGGLGLAASASLGDGGPGIFEPVHGSAPDIAGRGIANPAAMLRSIALLLRHAAAEPELAAALERAVDPRSRRRRQWISAGARRRRSSPRPCSSSWDRPGLAGERAGVDPRRVRRLVGLERSRVASERAMSSSPSSRHSRWNGSNSNGTAARRATISCPSRSTLTPAPPRPRHERRGARRAAGP